MRSPVVISLGLLCGLGLLVGCGERGRSPDVSTGSATVENGTAAKKTALNIMVSVLPQKYFVEKIGGDRVKVSVMVSPGIEPENYEPKPQQLKELSQADGYIGIGVLFEKVWGDRLTGDNQKLKWIDSSTGIEKLPMSDHDHEESTSHDHESLDPHIWISPKRVKQQAENIYQLLSELDPANEKIYAKNLDVFLAEIDQLDQAIAAQLKPLKDRNFLIFHPALGYFAADYNLQQIPIEIGGQEPSAAEIATIIKLAQEKNIHAIFAQRASNPQAIQAIAQEIKSKIIYIDPLAPNWSENLLEMTNQLVLANSPSP